MPINTSLTSTKAHGPAKPFLLAACLAASLSAISFATTAMADDSDGERLSGDEIQERVLGNRVQGAMAGGEAYDEVYREDGTIEGDGYTGQAEIVDDRMCFDYGNDETTCYGVRSDGDNRIEWLDGDEVVGEGELSDAE
ncbi:hypothetical protein [Salinicola halophyticus]|uniref:hypothetical protein n=1 Tax=Salinicola halophyticus TaxID=1808881 RepID=UPI003F454538